MIIVLSMAGVLWGVGWAIGVPRAVRFMMVALLMIAVVAMHIVLPDGHPLRENTGREPVLWIFIIVAGLLGWGYSHLLHGVRAGRAARRLSTMNHPKMRDPLPTRSWTDTRATLCCAKSVARGKKR